MSNHPDLREKPRRLGLEGIAGRALAQRGFKAKRTHPARAAVDVGRGVSAAYCF
jgi:hypothetical protein